MLRELVYFPDGKKAALFEDGVLVELFSQSAEKISILQNIYAGTVKRILPDGKTAFVEIGEKKTGYLALKDKTEMPRNGERILVQVDKEPEGEKGARLTRHATLGGRYVALVLQQRYIGISKKIADAQQRARLERIAEEALSEDWGIIFRTEAAGANDADIVAEIEQLQERVQAIMTAFHYSTAYLLWSEADLLHRLRTSISGIDRVLEAEDAHIHAANKAWKDISKREVGLKSGAYLVFDTTEALHVIDVNSGKNVGERLANNALAVNLEAAEEIARQLRLRDMGGIIVVDFIGLEKKAEREELLHHFSECIGLDRSVVRVYGISELELLQCTRKRLGNLQ